LRGKTGGKDGARDGEQYSECDEANRLAQGPAPGGKKQLRLDLCACQNRCPDCRVKRLSRLKFVDKDGLPKD
jgi:hypothetical protein